MSALGLGAQIGSHAGSSQRSKSTRSQQFVDGTAVSRFVIPTIANDDRFIMSTVDLTKQRLIEEVFNDRTPCIFGRLRSVCEGTIDIL